VLIEGCIIGAVAAGANRAFIFIRGEYELQAEIQVSGVAQHGEAIAAAADVPGVERRNRVELARLAIASPWSCRISRILWNWSSRPSS